MLQLHDLVNCTLLCLFVIHMLQLHDLVNCTLLCLFVIQMLQLHDLVNFHTISPHLYNIVFTF